MFDLWRRFRAWIIGATAVTAAGGALIMGATSADHHVYIGQTPTPTATDTPTPTPTPPPECTDTVNTSTFASAFSSATGGDTLCLASGSYGTFSGGDKSSPGVTIKPADGATVSFGDLNFGTGDDWITVDGSTGSLTIAGFDLGGTANNITIKDFEATGYSAIGPASMNNSNNVIDGGLFTLSDCPNGSCLEGEGRVTISGGSATNPAGVTIKNSTFFGNGSCGDGIQVTGGDNSARGVTIGPGNEFDTMDHQMCVDAHYSGNPGSAPHTDSMQVVNGCCFTVTGSMFHDGSFGLVGFFDDVHSVTFTNNVIVDMGSTSFCLGGGSGDVVQHNTFIDAPIYLCVNGFGDPETDVEWSDNIQWQNPNIQGSSSYASGFPNHVLCLSVAAGGEGDTCAGTGSLSNQAPSFAGGSNPATWDEWSDALLNGGSAGKNAASDGQDIGIDADLLP